MPSAAPRRTQEHRSLAVGTDLGEDVLLLRRFHGQEQLGRLFQFELDLVSEAPDKVDFDKILGSNVTVRLDLPGGGSRFFNGYVSRFAQVGHEDKLTAYHATLVPWLWLLTRTADCRIFQDMTVPDIIKQVFRDFGLTDFKDALSGSFKPRTFCVQYRETAFAFISRLMEQEGIYYYFQHDNGVHTLVLCDDITAHAPFPGYETLPYRARERAAGEDECVNEWVVEQSVQSGKVALNAFNFEKPADNLLTASSIDRAHPQAQFEVYDYPAPHNAHADGTRYARLRIEELHAGYQVFRARTDAHGLSCGSTLKVAKVPGGSDSTEYLVTTAVYDASSNEFTSGGSDLGDLFGCTFTAIDGKQPFRSPRATPCPVIRGPQTAIVVGPAGNEIHTDPFGRVRVQFHWDRYGKSDQHSSCWIRVAQLWAGKEWGALYTPRVGQEVIVEFLEGDPDQPIITGRVYNGQNLPPYNPEADPALSTLKSDTHDGAGFNEIRFQDKSGAEEIFVHGQRNLQIEVLKDRFEIIGENRDLLVKKDKSEHVEGERTEIIDKNHTETIKEDRSLTVKGKSDVAITKDHTLKVDGDVTETVLGKQTQTITKDLSVKAENIILEAKTKITLKVGTTTIVMDSGGITLDSGGKIAMTSATDTALTAGTNLTAKATSDAELAGLNTNVKADVSAKVTGSASAELSAAGQTTVKGAMVMIN